MVKLLVVVSLLSTVLAFNIIEGKALATHRGPFGQNDLSEEYIEELTGFVRDQAEGYGLKFGDEQIKQALKQSTLDDDLSAVRSSIDYAKVVKRPEFGAFVAKLRDEKIGGEIATDEQRVKEFLEPTDG